MSEVGHKSGRREDGAVEGGAGAGAEAPDAKRAAASDFTSREFFMRVYEKLRSEALSFIPKDLPAEGTAWQEKVIDYNVPGGKLNRGLTVPAALEAIRGKLTEEEAEDAAILGWCIEWLQAFFLVADDIMDAAPTRRGQPCWYKLPHVGMIAINDAFLLHSHLYKFIMTHFKGRPFYTQIMELFIETTWQTELGQQMDLTSAPLPGSGEAPDLDRYTMARYKGIVKYKTAYYSFYLPIACAMIMAGVTDAAILAGAEEILVEMGEYFQIQDDVLDAFADPSVLGKIGTDIQDSKCSWLVVTALGKATPEQRALLKEHYGKHDDASVAAVKALYVEMGLKATYEAYEEEVYARLRARITATSAASGGRVPEEVFLSLLRKIYKRHM